MPRGRKPAAQAALEQDQSEAVDHISERDLQATVVGMARGYGWMVYGVLEQSRYAKRLSKGYPDLTLVREGRLILAELKSEKGKLTPEQQQWLDTFLRYGQEHDGCCEVYVWRPSQLDLIEEMLK